MRRRTDGHLHALLARPPARLALATLPTPVTRAPWLDGPGARVWIKRDEQTSPVYGGGKVRKLEFVLAGPPHDRGDPIVSLGGIGSHHLVALAVFLAPMGRELHAWTFDQVLTEHTRTNLSVLASAGVRLWSARTRPGLAHAALRYYLKRLARGRRPGRFLTAGASDATGCLGFVEAGLELAEQIARGELPAPARIYLAGGSSGSAAGLALGLAVAGVSAHLRIVAAVEPLLFNTRSVWRLIAATHRRLRSSGLASPSARALLGRAGVQFSIDHGQVGLGYAVPTAAGAAAVALAAQNGLALETTYTGKCLAGLMGDIAEGRAKGDILWWNTHAGADLGAHIKPGWEARLPRRLRARLRTT